MIKKTQRTIYKIDLSEAPHDTKDRFEDNELESAALGTILTTYTLTKIVNLIDDCSTIDFTDNPEHLRWQIAEFINKYFIDFGKIVSEIDEFKRQETKPEDWNLLENSPEIHQENNKDFFDSQKTTQKLRFA